MGGGASKKSKAELEEREKEIARLKKEKEELAEEEKKKQEELEKERQEKEEKEKELAELREKMEQLERGQEGEGDGEGDDTHGDPGEGEGEGGGEHDGEGEGGDEEKEVLTARVSELESTNKSLEEELRRLEEEREREAQSKAKDPEMQKLKMETADLEDTLSRKENEHEAVMRKLQKQLENTRAELAPTTSKAQALEEENKILQQRVVTAAQSTQSLRQTLMDTQKKLELKEKELKSQHDTNQKLKKEMKSMLARNEVYKCRFCGNAFQAAGELEVHQTQCKKDQLVADARRLFEKLKPTVNIKVVDGPARGVQAKEVIANGAADRATIRQFDTILSVDSVPTDTSWMFQSAIQRLKPGDRVPFQVQQAHGPETLLVEVAAAGVSRERMQLLRRLNEGNVLAGDEITLYQGQKKPKQVPVSAQRATLRGQ
eukprot:TRINITY_DN98_c1_g3_i1.p1 TRINITY_DN98_c1_g3~~TRINITY_DN98_c1_g3_i1.p1  ORF type:complete len:431 (+),score=95.47 TRINITY_DN98_c1_g3_i1:371-1663(+)